MLSLIFVSAAATLTLFCVWLVREVTVPRARLRARVEAVARGEVSPRQDFQNRRLLRMQNYSALPLLREILQRSARAERIAQDLDRAAIPLRVGEYLMLRIATGLVCALIARLVLPEHMIRFLVLLLAFLLGMLIPRWVVMFRIRRRRAQIEAALPDALDMVSRALRAGSGLLQAIDTIVEQMRGAIADEFARTRQEIAAGLGAEEAFRGLDERVKSKDLHIVVTAIQIQREVGGNLAEILDNVASTMRERILTRAEMRVITSRQRLSAYLVAAVPVGMLAVLLVAAPQVVRPLLEEGLGRTLLGIAIALIAAGFLAMHQIASSYEV